MYVMKNPTKSEDYLHLAEFAYNSGYQTSINMSPFDVLYGQKCRTPVTWDSPMDQLMLGPNLLMKLEQLVTKVQVNLKEAQDLQKSYADRKRKDKDFQIGDHIIESKIQMNLIELGQVQ